MWRPSAVLDITNQFATHGLNGIEVPLKTQLDNPRKLGIIEQQDAVALLQVAISHVSTHGLWIAYLAAE